MRKPFLGLLIPGAHSHKRAEHHGPSPKFMLLHRPLLPERKRSIDTCALLSYGMRSIVMPKTAARPTMKIQSQKVAFH